MTTDREIEQLAMFTAALNTKLYGAEMQPGVYRPTWEDLGPAGQEAYLSDARIQFEAVEVIQAQRATVIYTDHTLGGDENTRYTENPHVLWRRNPEDGLFYPEARS